MKSIILKKDRDLSLKRKHPWIFSGAIQKMDAGLQSGETVEILNSTGEWMGRGAHSPHSQIAVRVWTFDIEERVTADFFQSHIRLAIGARRSMLLHGANAIRLIHGESDGLPGLIVDQYQDFLVCQFLSAGVEYWKETIVAIIRDLVPCSGIYERSDVEVRAKEGLTKCSGVLFGEEPPEMLEILEGSCCYVVDIRQGHKTGFYLDQRSNRALLTEYARGAEVLNCFAYTGAFGIVALKSGARHAIHIESSARALELLSRNLLLNNLPEEQTEMVEDDVFKRLRQYRDSRRQFDLIILDPPKFVDSRSQLMKGSRGYKDINLLAFKLLRPNGILFTFSCSSLIKPDLFHKIVSDAALDAGRHVQILHYMNQAPDHPVALSFPEGHYLKGLVCRVV